MLTAHLRLAVLLIACLVMFSVCSAATIVWDPSEKPDPLDPDGEPLVGDGVSWNDRANWSPPEVPSGIDDVIVGSNLAPNGELIISGSSAFVSTVDFSAAPASSHLILESGVTFSAQDTGAPRTIDFPFPVTMKEGSKIDNSSFMAESIIFRQKLTVDGEVDIDAQQGLSGDIEFRGELIINTDGILHMLSLGIENHDDITIYGELLLSGVSGEMDILPGVTMSLRPSDQSVPSQIMVVGGEIHNRGTIVATRSDPEDPRPQFFTGTIKNEGLIQGDMILSTVELIDGILKSEVVEFPGVLSEEEVGMVISELNIDSATPTSFQGDGPFIVGEGDFSGSTELTIPWLVLSGPIQVANNTILTIGNSSARATTGTIGFWCFGESSYGTELSTGLEINIADGGDFRIETDFLDQPFACDIFAKVTNPGPTFVSAANAHVSELDITNTLVSGEPEILIDSGILKGKLTTPNIPLIVLAESLQDVGFTTGFAMAFDDGCNVEVESGQHHFRSGRLEGTYEVFAGAELAFKGTEDLPNIFTDLAIFEGSGTFLLDGVFMGVDGQTITVPRMEQILGRREPVGDLVFTEDCEMGPIEFALPPPRRGGLPITPPQTKFEGAVGISAATNINTGSVEFAGPTTVDPGATFFLFQGSMIVSDTMTDLRSGTTSIGSPGNNGAFIILPGGKYVNENDVDLTIPVDMENDAAIELTNTNAKLRMAQYEGSGKIDVASSSSAGNPNALVEIGRAFNDVTFEDGAEVLTSGVFQNGGNVTVKSGVDLILDTIKANPSGKWKVENDASVTVTSEFSSNELNGRFEGLVMEIDFFLNNRGAPPQPGRFIIGPQAVFEVKGQAVESLLFDGAGNLEIQGTMNFGPEASGTFPGADMTVLITSTGQLNLANSGDVWNQAFALGANPMKVLNAGTITKSAGPLFPNVTSEFGADIENTGIISYEGGALDHFGEFVQKEGSIRMLGGEARLGSTLTMQMTGGEIIGDGILEASIEQNGGVVSPGMSTGLLTFDDYNIRTTPQGKGRLKIQIAAEEDFDKIDSLGQSIIFNGDLEVELLNNYIPNVGDRFRFLASSNGAFGGPGQIIGQQFAPDRFFLFEGDGSSLDLIVFAGTAPPDLSMSAPTQVLSGGTIAYSITLTAGDTILTGAEIRAFLPNGTTLDTINDGGIESTPGTIVWNAGSLASGLSTTVSYTVVAPGNVGTEVVANGPFCSTTEFPDLVSNSTHTQVVDELTEEIWIIH